MSIVNIICSICTEVFVNDDDVFSTNCGHLFHYVCLNNWLDRDKTCPQCRSSNPTQYKLHLSFMAMDQGKQPNTQEIELTIKSSEDQVAELVIQKEQHEDNLLKLQNQYSVTDTHNIELKLKLSQKNNDAEKEFLDLQAKYTDVAEIRKQFEDRFNQLSIENEYLIQASQKNDEHHNLELGAEHFVLPDDILQENIRVIEQKLKFATEELQKEIHSNTTLTIEKMKLESYINNYHSAKNKDKKSLLKEKNENNLSLSLLNMHM